jgi:hypothetical protein
MATFGTFAAGQVLTAAELNAGLPTCVLTNTSVSLINGTQQQVPFTVEMTDLNNWHSTTTNTERITPNIAGTYLVTAQINDVSGSVTRALIEIYKNGAPLSGTPRVMTDTPGTIDDFNAVGFVTMNGTTDYLTVNALVTGANKTATVQFSATRITS